MADLAIRVENLSKQYRIGQREPYKALRDTLTNAMYAPFRALGSLLIGRRSPVVGPRSAVVGHPDTIWALKDVSSEPKRRLGWAARVTFQELVRILMDTDLEAAGLPAPREGRRYLADSSLTWLTRP